MQIAKLWKRILNEGITCDGVGRESLSRMENSVIRSPVIVDSRLMDITAEEGRLWRWNLYKGLAMPFPRFWVEGNLSDGSIWGTMVDVRQEPEGFNAEVICITSCKGSSPHFMGAIDLKFNKNGDLDTRPFDAKHVYVTISKAMQAKMSMEDAVTAMCTDADSLCDVLYLLRCKNVSLRSNPTEPKQVARAVKRHGGKPENYTYHTLVVRPPGAKSDAPGQDIGIIPRHMCRGHFSEYGPEFGKGLLFGRYAGRFYIPPHLKGDKKNGIVEKDYEVQ